MKRLADGTEAVFAEKGVLQTVPAAAFGITAHHPEQGKDRLKRRCARNSAKVAGREGFEPPERFHVRRFSRPEQSTALPPTRWMCL